MARKRVESGIKDWAGADQALLAIGRLEREIEAIEADIQRNLELIKEQAVQMVKPLQEMKAALELQLQAFSEAHKDDFKGKSKTLNFGAVSFRLSSKIVIHGVKACLEALRSLGLKDYIRVKESPDKEKMKDLGDAILGQAGAKRVTEDVFGYEVNRERVKEAS
ncbi:MAG: host-nuclease inhibitor Gam family protein [Deltaproteobacteria bacterium]|nr:host-nuclease inhibitor Gam family protein [Deltaproteobacteria bacterium]